MANHPNPHADRVLTDLFNLDEICAHHGFDDYLRLLDDVYTFPTPSSNSPEGSRPDKSGAKGPRLDKSSAKSPLAFESKSAQGNGEGELERKRLQNRRAQRAFRERKAALIASLECQLHQVQCENARLRETNSWLLQLQQVTLLPQLNFAAAPTSLGDSSTHTPSHTQYAQANNQHDAGQSFTSRLH